MNLEIFQIKFNFNVEKFEEWQKWYGNFDRRSGKHPGVKKILAIIELLAKGYNFKENQS